MPLVWPHRPCGRPSQTPSGQSPRRSGIDQVLEKQPFQEGVHLAGHGTEVDRRAEQEGVGLGKLFQDGGQSVIHGAFPVTLPPF